MNQYCHEASVKAPWELEDTVHNLRLIRKAREDRGQGIEWARETEGVILQSADEMKKDLK